MNKRCFNTQEAMEYLGVRRRFFDSHIAPTLEGKAVRAGTSVVYERVDLDEAWDRYKLVAGSERAIQGTEKWDVQRKTVSTRRKSGRTMSTPLTEGNAFAAVVSSLTEKRKTSLSVKNN